MATGSAKDATCEEFLLGPLGSLLRVRMPEGGDKPRVAGNILILDRSGSMGQWCRRISESCVPDGLAALGCAETEPISVITFDSRTEVLETTVGGLRKSALNARGSTNMAPVVPQVQRLLLADPTKPFRLLVVSDGAVGDANETVVAAKNMALHLSHHRSAPTEVLLIRAMTSSYADPDTRCLACFGVLNESTTTQVVDVRCSDIGERATHDEMVNIIKAGFSTAAGSWGLSAASACLRRMPGAPPLSSLNLPPGLAYILLDPSTTSAAAGLTVSGTPLAVKPAALTSENDIKEFLELVEGQLRMRIVSGSGETRDVLSWCASLADHVNRVLEQQEAASSAAAAASGGDSETMLSLKDRARLLKREIERTQKSLLGRILSLRNADAVKAFSAAQQADFLRQGAADTKAARDLAKRAMRGAAISPDDFDANAQQALTKLAEQLSADEARGADKKLKMPAAAPHSFYSHSCFDEAFEAAAEVEDVADSLSFGKAMELVGGVGLAFEGPVGEFTDPWTYRVNRVYLGMALAQQDLWLSHQQGHGKALKFPGGGDDAVVTGVDLIRAPHPALYDSYVHAAGVINAMHASAFMRRKVALLPHDTLALKAAVTLRLIQQLPRESAPSAAHVRFLLQELLDCNHLLRTSGLAKYFDQLATDLNRSSNIGAYLTGDLDINGPLKPLLLCFGDQRLTAALADPAHAGRILRAVHALDCYGVARYSAGSLPEDRQKALETVLGINYAQHGTNPGEPGTPDPEAPAIHSAVNAADVFHRCKDHLPRITPADLAAVIAVRRALGDFAELERRYNELMASDSKDDPDAPLVDELCRRVHTSLTEVTNKAAFHFDGHVTNMVAAHVVQAILSPNLESRVQIDGEKRTYKHPDVDSDDAAQEYLASITQRLYQADYDRKLKEKRAVEKERAMELLIAQLLIEEDLRQFVAHLGEGIPDRSSPGYSTLEAKLLTDSSVKLRARKLWILVLGRSANGKPVWAAGNVLRGDLSRFQAIFVREEHGDQMWEKLKEMAAEYGRHTYREGAKNRHGHSNDVPSWWALGYKSLNEFRAAVGEAKFKEYDDARRANGGRDLVPPPPPLSDEERKAKKARKRRARAARAKGGSAAAAAAAGAPARRGGRAPRGRK